MAEEPSTVSASMLLGMGRRHLAVKDYVSATEVLAKACEALAAEHGESSDECAEAYLWYGKSLLGLSREESGVLGDGVTGSGNNEEEEDDDEEEENGEVENGKTAEAEAVTNGDTEKVEAQSTTSDEIPVGSTANGEEAAAAGPSNGGGDADESAVEETEDEVENLQLAWEMLDLSRSILERRGVAGRALLADVHLTLGEVALESETYDKAVVDMQTCLELQKQLYKSDDRRIAETHYQIGLANSLASNFEDAITHFKNAANILETRIKTLENPTAAKDDATVKKYSSNDPQYSVEAEIKELKELLPEIREKIQDMMDYKAETIKRVRETLFSSNGDGPSSSSTISSSNGAGSSSSSAPKPAASDISHLIKRKRKSSDTGEAEGSAPKRAA